MHDGKHYSGAREVLENAFEFIARKNGYIVKDSDIDVDANRVRNLSFEEKVEQISLLLEDEGVDEEVTRETIKSVVDEN